MFCRSLEHECDSQSGRKQADAATGLSHSDHTTGINGMCPFHRGMEPDRFAIHKVWCSGNLDALDLSAALE